MNNNGSWWISGNHLQPMGGLHFEARHMISVNSSCTFLWTSSTSVHHASGKKVTSSYTCWDDGWQCNWEGPIGSIGIGQGASARNILGRKAGNLSRKEVESSRWNMSVNGFLLLTPYLVSDLVNLICSSTKALKCVSFHHHFFYLLFCTDSDSAVPWLAVPECDSEMSRKEQSRVREHLHVRPQNSSWKWLEHDFLLAQPWCASSFLSCRVFSIRTMEKAVLFWAESWLGGEVWYRVALLRACSAQSASPEPWNGNLESPGDGSDCTCNQTYIYTHNLLYVCRYVCT